MFDIQKSELPIGANLRHYFEMEGCYTDCYFTEIDQAVSLPDFVAAFYVTPLFKLERFLLEHMASKPSTDQQARQVSDAQIDHFAAWRVEQRDTSQLLMCDLSERTRSWFMIVPLVDQGQNSTRLYFGSAVVPQSTPKNEPPSMGFAFRALLGFHKLYSRALLSAARAQLNRSLVIRQPA